MLRGLNVSLLRISLTSGLMRQACSPKVHDTVSIVERLVVSIGVNERDGDTLYDTQLLKEN